MNQELKSSGLLSLFDTTKAERETFINEIITKLDEGNLDPLKVHLQVKSMESIIEGLTKSDTYKSFVLDAAQKYGSKSFDFGNSKIQVKEAGSKYDYSKCNDSELIEITKKVEELTEKLKARQKFLQTVPGAGMTLVNESTGETYTVYPPSKTSTTIVSVTLK